MSSSPPPFDSQPPESWTLTPVPAWWVDHAPGENAPVRPDDHSVVLLQDTQVRVAERHCCMRTVTRLLTREAVAQLSQVQLEWDPATARLELHTVAIRRGGEVRNALARERVMVRQQESEQCRGILTGMQTVLLLLEDVRPGDVLEVVWSEVQTAALEEAKFDLLLTLASATGCGAWHLRVTAPADAPVQWRTYGIDLPPTVSESAGETLLEWQQEARPGLEPEPMAPPWSWPVPMLQISQFADWGAVARCIHQAWARARESSPAIAERARRIAEEHQTLEEQVTAAIEFVQSDVRYLGLSIGLDKLVPTTPDTVLRRLFGDCKDKSILLCALLQELGVTAHPVLVHTRLLRATGALLPALHAFDHAIAAVEWEGRTVFIDGTMAGQGGRIHDRHAGIYEKGLIIAEDTDSLTDLPAPPRSERPLTYTEDIYLSQSGKRSRIDWSLSGSGPDADFLRNAIRAHGAYAFAMDELRAVQQMFPHARRNGVEEIEDNVRENTYRIRGSYFMYDWGQRSSRHWNTVGVNGRWALRSVIAPPTDRKRTLPLRLNFPSSMRHEIRLHVKKFAGLKSSQNRTNSRWFEYTADLTYRTGEVELIFAWKALREEVAAAEFLTYVKDVETALKVTGMTLTFPWMGPYHVEVPAAGEEPARDEKPGQPSRTAPLQPRLPRAPLTDDLVLEIPDITPASVAKPPPPPLPAATASPSPLATAAAPLSPPPPAAAAQDPLVPTADFLTDSEHPEPERRRTAAPSRKSRRTPMLNVLWLLPAGTLLALIVIGIIQVNTVKLPRLSPKEQAQADVLKDPRWTAAQNAMHTKNFGLAEIILAELEQKIPGTPSVPGLRSVAALRLKEKKTAEAFAAEAAKRAPYHLHSMVARTELMMADHGGSDEVLKYAMEARTRFPDENAFAFFTARILQRQHRWREAAQAWKESLLKDPGHYAAVSGLRQCWKAEGIPQETERVLEELIKQHPNAGFLRLEHARMLWDRGQRKEVLAEIDAAEAYGKHPVFQITRAMCSLGGVSHTQAIDTIVQTINNFPDDTNVLFEGARAFYAAGRYGEVLLLTEKLSNILPDLAAPAWILRANAQLKTGALKEAIASLERQMEIDPLDGESWWLLARCLDQSGDQKRAAESRATAESLGWK